MMKNAIITVKGIQGLDGEEETLELTTEARYGIKDEEILSAIRRHTLGDANMTPLEYLIYVADFIEPNRKPFKGLEAVRAQAETDIARAARLCAKLSNEYVISRGGKLNSRTARMLNMQEEE